MAATTAQGAATPAAARATSRETAPRRDRRGHLERTLGLRAAAVAVDVLRLTADAGDLATLIGAHALLLQDADDVPVDTNWHAAELLAAATDQEDLTARLLRAGAALEHTDEQGDQRWAGQHGARLLVHYTDVPALMEAMAGTIRITLDGIGDLHILAAEHIDVWKLSEAPRSRLGSAATPTSV